MENQNWASIKSNTSAPYINQTLDPDGIGRTFDGRQVYFVLPDPPFGLWPKIPSSLDAARGRCCPAPRCEKIKDW